MTKPYEVELNQFVEKTKEILSGNLTGIYLHGSLVLGCFNPNKSDIDLIVVVNNPLSEETKRRLMDAIIEMNSTAPKKGLEISFVIQSVCNPFVYPTPFELHFSPIHLGWYQSNPDEYTEKMNGEDKDLAAHFTVIYHHGKCLSGLPISEVFGPVPSECYMDSIWEDVKNAETDITNDPVYLTLNLARVLAYKKDSLVLSKKEGAIWALKNLPDKYQKLISLALADYEVEEPKAYVNEDLVDYARYMLDEIRK